MSLSILLCQPTTNSDGTTGPKVPSTSDRRTEVASFDMGAITSARELISSARRIATFSGAGLSAESGIPTFRDALTGHWARYDPAELASPEGFARNPELIIEWYNDRRRTLASSTPNAAHQAMADRTGLLHVTQNVDHLLERAGAEQVLHLHGRIDSDRCHRSCGYSESIDISDPPGLRPCPQCGAPLRPAVVWFGEPLPEEVWNSSVEAVEAADLLIVIGTSGVVFPAAGLIDQARRGSAAVIVVNAEPIKTTCDITIIGSAAEIVPQLLSA